VNYNTHVHFQCMLRFILYIFCIAVQNYTFDLAQSGSQDEVRIKAICGQNQTNLYFGVCRPDNAQNVGLVRKSQIKLDCSITFNGMKYTNSCNVPLMGKLMSFFQNQSFSFLHNVCIGYLFCFVRRQWWALKWSKGLNVEYII